MYVQAEVKGQLITWLTPHPLQQVLTEDIDFNIMLNFLEFYEVTFLPICFAFVFSSSPFLLPFQIQTAFFTYHIIVKVPLLLCCRLFLLL